MNYPSVLHTDAKGNVTALDMATRLLRDRIILLTEEITNDTATNVVTQILYLNSEDDKKPIQLWIQSPGGYCDAGFSIIDAMKISSAPIHTRGFGCVASMASLILASGKKGERKVLPNCSIMIHQPLGGYEGQASDIKIHYERIEQIKQASAKLLADASGSTVSKVLEAIDRDHYLSAQEAIEFGKKGLIDGIITSLKD